LRAQVLLVEAVPLQVERVQVAQVGVMAAMVGVMELAVVEREGMRETVEMEARMILREMPELAVLGVAVQVQQLITAQLALFTAVLGVGV
jgi:hypothetical protein